MEELKALLIAEGGYITGETADLLTIDCFLWQADKLKKLATDRGFEVRRGRKLGRPGFQFNIAKK